LEKELTIKNQRNPGKRKKNNQLNLGGVPESCHFDIGGVLRGKQTQ